MTDQTDLLVPIWQQERYPREPPWEGRLADGKSHEASGEERKSHAAGARREQSREQRELQNVAPKGKTFAEENIDEQSEKHGCNIHGSGARVASFEWWVEMKRDTYLAEIFGVGLQGNR